MSSIKTMDFLSMIRNLFRMNISIDAIQKEIDRLFIKHNIPAITKNLPMENLQTLLSGSISPRITG